MALSLVVSSSMDRAVKELASAQGLNWATCASGIPREPRVFTTSWYSSALMWSFKVVPSE